MTQITRHGRQRVDNIEWSSDSWVHNVCRLWEIVFWKRLGESGKPGDTIRKESSVSWDAKRGLIERNFYTKEATFAYVEGFIRKAFGVKYWKEVIKSKNYLELTRQPLAVHLSALGFKVRINSQGKYFVPSLVVGAIAFGAAANGGTGGATWAHTVSGSNRIIFIAMGTINTGTPTADYNGVSATQIDVQATGPTNFKQTLFTLAAPATGANNVNISGTGDQGASSSYTGANQTGIPDAKNKGSSSNSTLTIATVTVLDNCWVVMGGTSESSASSSQSAGAGATSRSSTGTFDSSVTGIYDNNAAKTPAGSVSMTFTQSAVTGTPGMAGVTASFAPVQPTNGNFLVFM